MVSVHLCKRSHKQPSGQERGPLTLLKLNWTEWNSETNRHSVLLRDSYNDCHI